MTVQTRSTTPPHSWDGDALSLGMKEVIVPSKQYEVLSRRSHIARGIYAFSAVLTALLGGVVIQTAPVQWIPMGWAFLVAAAIFLMMIGTSWSRRRRRLISRHKASRKIWGRKPASLGHIAQVESLLAIPGTRVFYLPVQASGQVDVVVVCGYRVAFISSPMRWAGESTHQSALELAMERSLRLDPRRKSEVDLRTMYKTVDPHDLDRVLAVVSEVGAWLMNGNPRLVDRRLLEPVILAAKERVR